MSKVPSEFVDFLGSGCVPAVVFDSGFAVVASNALGDDVFFAKKAIPLHEQLVEVGYAAAEDSLKKTGFATISCVGAWENSRTAMLLRRGDLTLIALDCDRTRGFCNVGELQHIETITRDFVQQLLLNLDRLDASDAPEADETRAKLRRQIYVILKSLRNYIIVRRYNERDNALSLANCNLSEIVRSICDAANAVCRNGPKVKFVGENGIACRADKRLIETAVINLIDNSMVYSRDNNVINVSVKTTGSMAVITVADKGAGIKPELLGSIVKPFFSADPSNDGEPAKGVGLGLAATQRVAQLHGGALYITGVFGEGSTASFSIPSLVCDDGEILNSATVADYVTDSFSPIYVGLCSHCELSKR